MVLPYGRAAPVRAPNHNCDRRMTGSQRLTKYRRRYPRFPIACQGPTGSHHSRVLSLEACRLSGARPNLCRAVFMGLNLKPVMGAEHSVCG